MDTICTLCTCAQQNACGAAPQMKFRPVFCTQICSCPSQARPFLSFANAKEKSKCVLVCKSRVKDASPTFQVLEIRFFFFFFVFCNNKRQKSPKSSNAQLKISCRISGWLCCLRPRRAFGKSQIEQVRFQKRGARLGDATRISRQKTHHVRRAKCGWGLVHFMWGML